MSCLVVLIKAQYVHVLAEIRIIVEGPLIFLLLQYLEIWSFLMFASTNAVGQTVMKRIQSTKKGSSLYCAFMIALTV